MNKNKNVKRVLGWMGVFAVLFVLLLLTHIVIMVKRMPILANPTLQLARVDFKEPLDSLSIGQIRNKVVSQKGVKSTYYNQRDDILIYTFDNRLNNARTIYDNAIVPSGYASVRYVVTAKDLQQGCPVMSNDSFYGKLTALVAKIVK